MSLSLLIWQKPHLTIAKQPKKVMNIYLDPLHEAVFHLAVQQLMLPRGKGEKVLASLW